MAKIRNIFEIQPTLGFTEFDILKKYQKSFECSELGRIHSLFPYSSLASEMGLKASPLGRRSYFSASGKIALMVLKSYTGLSDRHLIEQLNGNIHFQLFCGILIDPSHPITNYKIVSAIRQELADKLDVESLQVVLAKHWRPYLDNLHVCMTDATYYESYMRHPTDLKLLRESVEWLYRHLCKDCRRLGIRLKECIRLQQKLTQKKVTAVAAGSIYANNTNRKYCTKKQIATSFVRKGRAAKDEKLRQLLRSELSWARATRLEGSFGTHKQHYSLAKVKARNRETEILWIFFGIHTSNAVLMIEKVRKRKMEAA